jgi:hypothetical protein
VEKAEGLESGSAGAEAIIASGVDPVAVALALNGTNIDPSVAEDARAFLRKQSALAEKQSALVDDQCHHVAVPDMSICQARRKPHRRALESLAA